MFRVQFDPEIPCWSLGEIECTTSTIDSRVFKHGKRLEVPGPLSVRVKDDGPSLDINFGAWLTPIVTRRVGRIFENFAADSIQLLPVSISGIGADLYEVLNITRLVDAIDRDRSRYLLWRPEDNRPDLLGDFRDVRQLVLKRTLPSDLHTFRIKGWEVVWVVSAPLKDALEEAGCRGAIFQPLEQ